MPDDATRRSVGERILQEIGLLGQATGSDDQDLPIEPEHLETAALRTLTGRFVICPCRDVALHGTDGGQHRLTGDAWIAADWTLPLEDWR